MTNEQKAKQIAEESKQFFYHDEYECGLACAIRMAEWKDEQHAKELSQSKVTKLSDKVCNEEESKL